MSAPEFTSTGHQVLEDGKPIVLQYSADAAKRYAEYLTKEHANGRVAQGRCPNGACDRERIHDLERFAAKPTRPVVLCAEHALELEKARPKT